MLRDLWRKTARAMFLASLTGVTAGGLAVEAYGQDVDINNLLQRLERLEKQNQELQNKLATSPVATDAVPVDTKTIENVVGAYLNRQADAKKKEEAKKAPEFVAVGSDLNIKTTWKDGLNFQTTNGDFKVHVGGRVHYDWGWYPEISGDLADRNFDDGADFRRGRLRVDGSAWEIISWVVEFDFANVDGFETLTDTAGDTTSIRNGARASFTDVYMDITQLPWLGTFRAGRFKVPFSLDEMTSSRYTNLLERSLPHQVFAPSRRLGFMFTNTVGDQERMTWAAGAWRADDTGNGSYDDGDGEYLYAGRVTGLPYYAHEGRCLLHVGGAFVNINHNVESNDDPRYRSRVSLRIGNAPRLLDTGNMEDIRDVNLYGGEVGANFGPVNFMAEVMAAQNHTDIEFGANPLFWGAYAQVSVFLTGEHRPYNKKSGTWDRVRPHEPFYLVKGGSDDEGRRVLFGRGAVELVGRYSYLDLSSPGANPGLTQPGFLQDITVGLNWYFNPNFKWQVNAVRGWRDLADVNDDHGTVTGVAMRFAWDF